MLFLGSPYSKDEIWDAISAETTQVQTYFSSIPFDQFFASPAHIWSPAENLIHLTQSSKPLALFLSLPRIAIRLRFGKSPHDSRTIQAVRTEYTDAALAGGGVASGEFIPLVKEKTELERDEILDKWLKTSGSVTENLTNWKETDLDTLCAPHPLLGTMTARELLFFTLYHNMHHVRDVQTLLGQPLDEWFDT